MIVIHIVDNFPFPTIDTITAAFSTISKKQKRIASSSSEVDAQTNSIPLEAEPLEESVAIPEAHIKAKAAMLNNSYVNFDEGLML